MKRYKLMWNGYPWGDNWATLEEAEWEARRLRDGYDGNAVFRFIQVVSVETDITEEVEL
jgi:hypothetical protein